MGVKGLHKSFFPGSVAVFGLEDTEDSMGRTILQNLLSTGFKGRIYPIQPGVREVAGLPAYSEIQAIGEPVDLAVLATPIAMVPAAIEDCGQARVNSVVVTARIAQQPELFSAILEKAHTTGIRLIGPRSWGIVSPWAGLNAGLGRRLPLPGKLAVISQSAAVCATILDLSLTRKIGLSILVGLGDMLDVDCADLLDYVAHHARVGAILLHVKTLSNLRKFMSAARAASRIKPIVVLKTGRSQSDSHETATPAGNLISEDAVYDAAFKRAGIIRVETVEDLFDCGDLVSKQPRPRGPNLAIITNVHTPGIMAVDFLADHGLDSVELCSDTVSALDHILPSCWSRRNPINITTEVPSQVYRQVLEICFSSREIEGTLIILSPQFLSDPAEVARAISAALVRKAGPVLAVWMGGEKMDNGRRILDEAGIPTYDAPERAVRAFLYLYAYDHNLRLLQEIPPRLTRKFEINRARARKIIDSALREETEVLNDQESLNLLQAYDLPTVPMKSARSVKKAVQLADNMGYPVTLRLLTRHIKTRAEAKEVKEGLCEPGEVKKAFEEIMGDARSYNSGTDFLGVAVQPTISRPDFELSMGSRQVPPFGPVLLFGQAGMRPEISSDHAIGLPPLNRMLARRIIEGTRVYRLLKGEGRSQTDCTTLVEELLVNLSYLVTDFPEIAELEVSPLLVTGDRAIAANAFAIIRPARAPSPMHLIISPYPDEYETFAITKLGLKIFIRPIKPEDAPLLQELWSTLSPRTIYYRFSRPIEELTPELLVRFTQIDYDREIALVALESTGKGERMLAVGRLSGTPGANLAEFTVVVGDPWQGQGVGAQILSRLIMIAINRKIKRIWGLVLQENTTMIELARKLRFTIVLNEDFSQLEVSLDLSAADASKILESVS